MSDGKKIGKDLKFEVVERRVFHVADTEIAEMIREAIKAKDWERLDELTGDLENHDFEVETAILKCREVREAAPVTTKRAACDICGARRVLRQGEFTIRGRVFSGWVCRTCGTWEECGGELRVTNDGETTCPQCEATETARVA